MWPAATCAPSTLRRDEARYAQRRLELRPVRGVDRVGLVLTPIIIDALGQEGYGVWLFIGSVTIVLRLLDFGISPTVVRFTAFHRGRDAPDEIDALASTSLAVFVVLGACPLR